MLYRRSGSKKWYYKFKYNGAVIQRSAKTSNRTIAVRAEQRHKNRLAEGLHDIPRPKKTPLFSKAASEWLESRRGKIAPNTFRNYTLHVASLTTEFGGRLVCDVRAADIERLQSKRLESGLKGRTINLEVGVLAQILRREKLWGYLADSVPRLAERHDVGKQIPREDEESLLLPAIQSSGSPALLPLYILSVDTGLRASEIRALRHRDLALEWSNGVIASGQVVVPKSKTVAGTGRVVPLTMRACGALTLWLARFPDATADSFVFPRHGVTLAAGRYPRIRDVQLDRPMGEWKTAWRRALRIAGVKYRWHDGRHSFVSRLAENPHVSESTIMGMAGHVSKRMLERYSHVRMEAKRAAISALEQAHGAVKVDRKEAFEVKEGLQKGLQSNATEALLPH
jgi:integrase